MNKIRLLRKDLFIIFKSLLLVLFIFSLFTPLIIKDYIQINPNNIALNLLLDRTPSFIFQTILTLIYFFEYIKNKFKIKFVYLNKYILIIFSYAVINLFLFNDPLFIFETTYYFKYFQQVLFMIFLTNEFLQNKRIYKISVILYLTCSLIISLLLINNIFSLVNSESGRMTLIGWKENDLSIYISFAYAILISFLADFKKIDNKYFFLLLIGCSLIFIKGAILTGTRAALLSISITNLLLLFSIFLNKYNPIKKTIIVLSNCSFMILNTINNESINDRVFIDNFNTAGGRLVHWLFALKINKNPFFGIGLEDYQQLSIKEIGQWDPQNLLIELYGIAGIIPILMIFIVMTSLIYNSFKYYFRTALLSKLILLIPILINILLFNLWNYKVFFIFIVFYSCHNEYINLKLRSLKD